MYLGPLFCVLCYCTWSFISQVPRNAAPPNPDEPGDWLKGANSRTKAQGYFPGNYVRYEPPTNTGMPAMRPRPKPKPRQKTLSQDDSGYCSPYSEYQPDEQTFYR